MPPIATLETRSSSSNPLVHLLWSGPTRVIFVMRPDFFFRYAARNGGIFVDCAIHDIDLSLWYLNDPVPKACWTVGTLQHHPELKDLSDVDNAVGVVEFWGARSRISIARAPRPMGMMYAPRSPEPTES